MGTQHGEDIEADIGIFLRLLTSMIRDAISVVKLRGFARETGPRPAACNSASSSGEPASWLEPGMEKPIAANLREAVRAGYEAAGRENCESEHYSPGQPNMSLRAVIVQLACKLDHDPPESYHHHRHSSLHHLVR
jgi:hypothetical protein